MTTLPLTINYSMLTGQMRRTANSGQMALVDIYLLKAAGASSITVVDATGMSVTVEELKTLNGSGSPR